MIKPASNEYCLYAFRPIVNASALGCAKFRADYGLKYAYLSGSMYKGIASRDMVVAMAGKGMMGYLGAGGLKLDRIESDIRHIQEALLPGLSFGVNLLNSVESPALEAKQVELFLSLGVRYIEAAAFMKVTNNLVRYRFTGARRHPDGSIFLPNYILAKVSRPEVAVAFMSPPPADIVSGLVAAGHLTVDEGILACELPMAGEICVESDSGGHTDQGVAFVLLPTIIRLRNEIVGKYKYGIPIRVGAAGGIGTPEAALAAFILGADFILTGSINQCTIEAHTSDAVKDMLQSAAVQDTDYAPAGDMFELGAQVQVLKKGLFFPARAKKLFDIYSHCNSIDEIDVKTLAQIESRYFNSSLAQVWNETKFYYMANRLKTEDQLESNEKQKMALIFRWYFVHSTRLAMSGSSKQRVDYQIHCGPAMGAFNQWVKGTDLEPWRNRSVAKIGEKIMESAAALLSDRLLSLNASIPRIWSSR